LLKIKDASKQGKVPAFKKESGAFLCPFQPYHVCKKYPIDAKGFVCYTAPVNTNRRVLDVGLVCKGAS
jgi:hypothetical protein